MQTSVLMETESHRVSGGGDGGGDKGENRRALIGRLVSGHFASSVKKQRGRVCRIEID